MYIGFVGGKKVALATPNNIDEALEYSGTNIKVNVVNPATSKFPASPMKQNSFMKTVRSIITQ